MILITGFGPFGDHQVNASWEAVKLLKDLCADIEKEYNVQVVVKEIEVNYEHVSINLPKYWEEYDPMVVVHVGVSHKAKCLTLECKAHSSGYNKPDVCNKCPCKVDSNCVALKTEINVEELCQTINESSQTSGCEACVSENAGRYLCEYTFYESLRNKPSRTVFVHVPDFQVYSKERTAKGLYCIVRYLVEKATET